MCRNLVGRFEEKYHKFLSFDVVTQTLQLKRTISILIYGTMKINYETRSKSASVKKKRKLDSRIAFHLYLNFIAAQVKDARWKSERWKLDSIFHLLENF